MPHIRISELRLDSTVVVATGNPHKVTEIEEILGPRMPGVRFVALGELGDFPEPVEDGSSFFDNAMIKARDALDETGLLVAVADDSGLCVDSLGGAPGIFSARFAGEPCDDAANNAKLLRALDKIHDTTRTAHFHSTVVMLRDADDGRRDIIFWLRPALLAAGYAGQDHGGAHAGREKRDLAPPPRARRPRRSAAEEPRCTAGPYCQIFVNKPLSGYNRVSL